MNKDYSKKKMNKPEPRGRPGAYAKWSTEEGLIRIAGWVRDGLTNKQIAENIGISVQSLTVWRRKHPEFNEVMLQTKDVVDRHVENMLYKRACGYEYDEVTEATEETEDGFKRIKKVVHKHVAPDVTAQIFWLKNRKPPEWRDKQDVEVTTNINIAMVLQEARKRVNKHNGETIDIKAAETE